MAKQNKQQHLQRALEYIRSGIDTQNYDMADKYAHQLLTPFCGIRSDRKAYQLGQHIKKTVQSLDHRGRLLVQSGKNVRIARKIRLDLIDMYSITKPYNN